MLMIVHRGSIKVNKTLYISGTTGKDGSNNTRHIR